MTSTSQRQQENKWLLSCESTTVLQETHSFSSPYNIDIQHGHTTWTYNTQTYQQQTFSSHSSWYAIRLHGITSQWTLLLPCLMTRHENARVSVKLELHYHHQQQCCHYHQGWCNNKRPVLFYSMIITDDYYCSDNNHDSSPSAQTGNTVMKWLST